MIGLRRNFVACTDGHKNPDLNDPARLLAHLQLWRARAESLETPKQREARNMVHFVRLEVEMDLARKGGRRPKNANDWLKGL